MSVTVPSGIRAVQDGRSRVARRRGGVGWRALLWIPKTLIAMGALACSPDGVENPSGVTDVDALPRFTITETQRIGSVEDPDIGFARISGVDVDRDGRVYVLEGQDREIRVYDTDGSLLRRIGRPGEGPGEFQSVPRFGVVGDTVWAFENDTRRLTIFDRSGRLLEANRIPDVTVQLEGVGSGMLGPFAMREDGRFVAEISRIRVGGASSVPEADSYAIPVVLFDAAGQVVDTIGSYDWVPPPSTNSVVVDGLEVPRPFRAEPLTLFIVDGTLSVHRPLATTEASATFTVTKVAFSRDTTYHRVYRYHPRGYSEALLDSLASRYALSDFIRIVNGSILGTRPVTDTTAAIRKLRASMDFPAFQPPVQARFVGADGGVWLGREDSGSSTRDWLLLDPSGGARGILALPYGERPAWSRGDVFWIVETDDLGVPWLVRYRLSPS